MNVTVRFHYVLQQGKPPLNDSIHQMRYSMDITIEDAPERAWEFARSMQGIIWQAEDAFLARIEDLHPFDHLVEWQSFDPTGRKLSEYRTYLSD